MVPPKVIMFDMDDTLIRAYSGDPEQVWCRTLEGFRDRLGGTTPEEASSAIHAAAQDFWADRARHREGRLNLERTRSEIARTGLSRLGHSDAGLADAVSEAFHKLREREMQLFPHAHETLDGLREAGVLLALITNGESQWQRPKIERFDLEHRFEHIQVEEEFGVGKPEPESYLNILRRFDVTSDEVWIVGDNLEWEVAAPQRLGIHSIWHDHRGDGLPEDAPATPDRIIRGLSELLHDFEG